MGIAYLNLGQYDSARIDLERALEFHKKGDDKERLCSCQDNLGGAYYKLELYDKAGEAFDASNARNSKTSSQTSPSRRTLRQKEGIKIDGIGIQGHWGLEPAKVLPMWSISIC